MIDLEFIERLIAAFDDSGVDSLEIERGDFVAMAGPSGSGKTTVLNLLGGLTKASRGRIWVGNEELSALDGKSRTLPECR